jgi:coenzyme F420-reducing hydrogenase delta subunit
MKLAVVKPARIVVFTCNWYPAIAADNAGIVGRSYTADCRIMTLACAGHVTPATILDAFGSGAQGVLVAACKPELCHYLNGSSKCEEVVKETKELACLLGIGDERIGLETFDSEDVERFASCVDEFQAKIAGMGAIVFDRPA